MLARYFQLNKFSEYNSSLLHHNILMHAIDGSIFLFAISFISVSTVLPVFIQRIGGNAIAVGSVSVLWYLGLYMPQLIFIKFFHNKKKIKPAVLGTGLIYRFQFLVLSAVCFLFLGDMDAKISVPLMLFLIFISTIAGSTTGPTWFHFFSKTTPVKLRGRLLALRWMLGSALGLIAGYLVSVILSSVSYPDNFALLFLLCFIFTMVSFYFLNSVEESSETPADSKQVLFKEILSRSKEILSKNKDFKNYLLADALILMSLTASSFFAVYAVIKFNLPTSYAGTFTMILMAGQLLGNFIFGYLGDYFGHKINILILASTSAAASLSAVLANNVLVFGVVLFF
jgi:MFS family permease